ncbi:hypothetical protein SESBI_26847 [Sesbania bispinosa]|nr:hypothetical protein SESBI_26847 [Sesbania bispinosa]
MEHFGFTWVRREINQAAHFVAFPAAASNLPRDWMFNPPSQLRHILDRDKAHIQLCNSPLPS